VATPQSARGDPVKSGWTFAALMVAAMAGGLPMGCGSSSGGQAPDYLDRNAMLDPQTCQSCHAGHYQQWAASMHAAASDDPIFRAMNMRGQAETKGQLGSFCIKCHAPTAFSEGATTDGLNLDTVPRPLHGVTCFFCHSIDSVTGSHNAAVSLSGDLVMRGEFSDPAPSSAHASAYDTLHDRNHAESASLCGACHDIVTPGGAHIERTYAEWQGSVFSSSEGDTCNQCHMNQSASKGPIAQVSGESLPARYTYAHDFPGVDVGLPGGSTSEQSVVEQFLQTTLQTALCVTQQGGVRAIVDNVAAGHFWPSGAAQDRRAWAEVVATKAGKVIYQSGVVPEGGSVTALTNDPDLWLLRDCMFDTTGNQVDMFWQAASTESNELPAPVTFVTTDPNFYKTHVYQLFPRAMNTTLPQMPDQVTLRFRIQPIGVDVLQSLVASGNLDAGVVAEMPILDVTPIVTWTPATATLTYQEQGQPVTCVSPSNLNVAADKTLAVNHVKCSP
jgi:hypothetical protein